MAAERILIAEDNEKNIKLFRDVPQLSGYETLAASTGEQAIKLATRHTPDLVLMDIRRPGTGGLEALRRLHKAARTADIPVSRSPHKRWRDTVNASWRQGSTATSPSR